MDETDVSHSSEESAAGSSGTGGSAFGGGATAGTRAGRAFAGSRTRAFVAAPAAADTAGEGARGAPTARDAREASWTTRGSLGLRDQGIGGASPLSTSIWYPGVSWGGLPASIRSLAYFSVLKNGVTSQPRSSAMVLTATAFGERPFISPCRRASSLSCCSRDHRRRILGSDRLARLRPRRLRLRWRSLGSLNLGPRNADTVDQAKPRTNPIQSTNRSRRRRRLLRSRRGILRTCLRKDRWPRRLLVVAQKFSRPVGS